MAASLAFGATDPVPGEGRIDFGSDQVSEVGQLAHELDAPLVQWRLQAPGDTASDADGQWHSYGLQSVLVLRQEEATGEIEQILLGAHDINSVQGPLLVIVERNSLSTDQSANSARSQSLEFWLVQSVSSRIVIAGLDTNSHSQVISAEFGNEPDRASNVEVLSDLPLRSVVNGSESSIPMSKYEPVIQSGSTESSAAGVTPVDEDESIKNRNGVSTSDLVFTESSDPRTTSHSDTTPSHQALDNKTASVRAIRSDGWSKVLGGILVAVFGLVAAVLLVGLIISILAGLWNTFRRWWTDTVPSQQNIRTGAVETILPSTAMPIPAAISAAEPNKKIEVPTPTKPHAVAIRSTCAPVPSEPAISANQNLANSASTPPIESEWEHGWETGQRLGGSRRILRVSLYDKLTRKRVPTRRNGK